MFCKMHKAQFTFMARRIDNLEKVSSDYVKGERCFPYSNLYKLRNEISSISNNHAKIELLTRLKDQIVGRLVQFNPKLFSYYEELNQEIIKSSKDDVVAHMSDSSSNSL